MNCFQQQLQFLCPIPRKVQGQAGLDFMQSRRCPCPAGQLELDYLQDPFKHQTFYGSMKDTSNRRFASIPSTQPYQVMEQLMDISVHCTDTGCPSESISPTPLTFLPNLSHPAVFNPRNKPIPAAISMGSGGTSSWDQFRGFSHRDELVGAVSSTHSFPKPGSSRQS